MQDAPYTARIPLYRRGHRVAEAIVDEANHHWLSEWCWHQSYGYAVRGAGRGVLIYMHRLILGLEPGDGRVSMFRNGDCLDCRRANLVRRRALPGRSGRGVDGLWRIALHSQDDAITGYAVVDEADYRQLHSWPWHLTPSGYAMHRRRGFMHRVILQLPRGDPREGDHINGERLDNRRANLRIVTHAQNQQNRRGASRANTSGYRGVSWLNREQCFIAQVQIAGRHHTVGYFDDEREAAAAAAAFRAEHMPYSTN